MKLIRASFENFRLLRDLELEFSTELKRPLTVIRAANETGKTTILTALQWAFYGDNALPGKSGDYRLHPIDWDSADSRVVNISVTVDFEVSSHRRTGGILRETRRRYRLNRCAMEEISGKNWRRSRPTVSLFLLTDRGADPIDAPDAIINEELPPELREVFFTDGDRALSFIEAEVALSTKRARVQRAIRSLLGLGIIEDAQRHIQATSTSVNRRAKKLGSGTDLSDFAAQLEDVEKSIDESEGMLKDAVEQFANFDSMLADIDKKISSALVKGDKEKLKHDLEVTKKKCKSLDRQIESAIKDHAALFRSQALATDILAPVLQPAFALLEELRDRGKIPNTTIPILEDRLSSTECICGESLDTDTPEGVRRREHILSLIESSRKADAIQGTVTDLYFGSRSLAGRTDGSSSEWLRKYSRVVESRDGLHDLREQEGRKLRAIDLQIDQLPDTDIHGLRETKRMYLQQRDRFLSKKTQTETRLEGFRKRRTALSATRDKLLREKDKGARVLSELQVVQDIRQVLQRSYERITSDELHKVSRLMNDIFLDMIGSDPEQGAIIRRAEISPDFDIIVYGPQDRTLNPDRDLNGASRRALTLAFILALTRVSEVEAPNVIDTPLGMMSGYVKRSVLQRAIKESSQLVLFLTHSEIYSCEALIDEFAGTVLTLTNPAHYPRILLNDPGIRERKILRCSCNHRNTCSLCERRLDFDGPNDDPDTQSVR